MIIFIVIMALVGTFIIPINEPISANYNIKEEKNILEVENSIQDFIIYYGDINDKKIKELSKYSLVIIEPRNITKNQVITLKNLGVKVLGYMSVVEQNENNIEFVGLKDSWFYKPYNEKIKIYKWQSWYMDIRKKGYQNFLLEQLYLHIVDKNLDGVFLDTVGDIDDSNWRENDKKGMRENYEKFLLRIKNNYKDLEIVQNWGFETAKNYSAKHINGIMWEGFSFDLLKNDEWSQNRIKDIKDMDIDLYIVTPKKENINKNILNNKLYVHFRNSDIYDTTE
ncbi:glycoside hydrolase family 66 protein [Tepidibacter hydrothermalis]|uniref:Endo alpha-1,4 polygalactosaminidase n=1 Tax=Tepidibacter hydrothermalis TaxID=3036126 RepID=A0ABY8EHV9_9FIRM|nr:endo alpha-1,4 polygalactosaminidase [Tepidibacter hydrothermalis]WFD11127.1 endo alpha-1,4 polygalactosaminidase [Tepidibacter hydrothermalis]